MDDEPPPTARGTCSGTPPAGGDAAPPPPAAPRGVAMPAAPDTRLIISLGLNLVITLLQVAGGILANSLGLLSDAAHNLSDVVALGLSLWAVRLGRRPSTPRRTFAYKRAEILVAMFNSAVLVAISIYIIVEAVGRIRSPQPVEGLLVVFFAAAGLIINGISALLLRSHGNNLNLRSAFLHLLGDAATSLGVMLSGLIVYLTGWNYADAIVSILVSYLDRPGGRRDHQEDRQRAHGRNAGERRVRRSGSGNARRPRRQGRPRPAYLVHLLQRSGPVGACGGGGRGPLGAGNAHDQPSKTCSPGSSAWATSPSNWRTREGSAPAAVAMSFLPAWGRTGRIWGTTTRWVAQAPRARRRYADGFGATIRGSARGRHLAPGPAGEWRDRGKPRT